MTSTIANFRTPDIRFQGYKTTVIAQGAAILPEERKQKRRKLLDEELLQQLIRSDNNHYYEDLPQPLLDAFEHNLPQLRATLDALKKDLTRHPLRGKNGVRQYTFGPPEKAKPLTVTYVNEGDCGIVYKIAADHQTYALKVFKTGIPFSQPYEEVANGAYLSSHKIRDVARLYMARPSAKWMLMEFIDKHTTLEGREGKTMAQQCLETDDDCHIPNRINGILVDYGGSLYVPAGYLDEDTFERKLKLFDQRVSSQQPFIHPRLCCRERPMKYWHLLQSSPYSNSNEPSTPPAAIKLSNV